MFEWWNELCAPELGFLRYAMLLGVLAAPALGVVGTMVVTRRISSLAGASAHAALGGVGLALYLQRVWMWKSFTPELGAVFGRADRRLGGRHREFERQRARGYRDRRGMGARHGAGAVVFGPHPRIR